MEIKNWIYEEFPEYTEKVEGAVRISATGNEMGVYYRPDIEYAKIDGVPLHLQVLEPFSRNEPEKFYPCLVFVQGSAWMQKDMWLQSVNTVIQGLLHFRRRSRMRGMQSGL